MEGLDITVVIPTYKRSALLMRCMGALLRQTLPARNFEIIIISDGEDPSTRAALDSADHVQYPVIRYYELPSKAGPAAARNLGWLLAQADLIAFTDDDCIPADNWLHSLWNGYSTNRLAEVAFSGSTEVPISHRHPTDYERSISELASAEFITANCACTKQALQHVNGFDERFRMAWREDMDLQFKFILHGIPIIKVTAAIVTHPVRKVPWGVSLQEERKRMFNALLYKKYPRLYKEKIETASQGHYYGIVFLISLFIAGLIFREPALILAGLAGWIGLTSWIAFRRLRATSHSWNHVSEMIFTSAFIPALSLFWKLYGSLKFKVFRIL